MEEPKSEYSLGGVLVRPEEGITAEHCYRIYESIWRNMDREDALISQRITWAILLTSGFLTAEAFLLGRVIETVGGAEAAGLQLKGLLLVSCLVCAILSVVGAVFCGFTQAAVRAAQRQHLELKRRYETSTIHNANLFEAHFHLPRPFGAAEEHESGAMAARLFPRVMVAIWIAFAVMQLIGGVLVWTVWAR